MNEVTINNDGTVTYWSVLRQQWVTASPNMVTNKELACLPDEERDIIKKAR